MQASDVQPSAEEPNATPLTWVDNLRFVAFLAIPVSLIFGLIWLIKDPEPELLATLTLEQGQGSAAVRVSRPSKVGIELDVRAGARMQYGDLSEELQKSTLEVSVTSGTASDPGASKKTCSAFNGWSDSGRSEKDLRTPRIKAAENDCMFELQPGDGNVAVRFEWKGLSPAPTLEAHVVAHLLD